MAVIYSNQSGYIGEAGVIGTVAALATASAVVTPGQILMMSNANYSVIQLTCSALGTSGNSCGSLAIPDGGFGTLTITKPVANMKIIFSKVGATLKLSTSGPHQPVGQNG